MIIKGQQIDKRGCNKKYTQLDNLDWLYEQLDVNRGNKTIAELSKELEIPQNSIRFRVVNYFPDDWISNIRKGRAWRSGLRGLPQ